MTKETAADAGLELVRFAARLRFADIPDFVIAKKKQHIVDVIGAALAGTTAEGIPELCRLASEWGGRREATIIGSGGVRVPAPLAALTNAAMGRALEMDDVHEKAMCHPTVAVTPLALAVAESAGDISGKEFLSAVIAGEEVLSRLCLAPEYHVSGPKHRPRGWSFTYQAGILGGAVAAGKLLRLEEAALHDAFGNAYTALAGNQQCVQEGVLAIRVQQGVCAQTAVQSALFARAGISGTKHSLEGKFGWLSFWHGNQYDRKELLGELGSRWEVANFSIKPYPCGKITHPSIVATLQVMSQSGLTAEDVERITIHVNSRESWDEVVHPVEKKRMPPSAVEAPFCLPYLCAVALVKGSVRLEDVNEPAIRDPKVLAMAQRVYPVLDPDSEISRGRIMPFPVTVDLLGKDGRIFSSRCEFPVGHPKNPMTGADIERKFMDSGSVSKRYSTETLAEIRDTVARLEELSDVGELSRLLG